MVDERWNMHTTLITGAGGMIGSHLYESMQAQGKAVIGTYYAPTVPLSSVKNASCLIELDVRYRWQLHDIISRERPLSIFHLAAQSLPVKSWKQPQETFDVNVNGTINLFESVKDIRRGDPTYDPTIIVACSSAEYGASLTPDNVPVTESVTLIPVHPYGVSKVTQDLLSTQYWLSDRIRAIPARIFNTTGPRKRDDLVSDLSKRCALVRNKGAADIRVGNIDSRRAILDVRDLITALTSLAENGEPGEPYNICNTDVVSGRDVLEILSNISGVALRPIVDPDLTRSIDEPIIFGCANKIRRHTGWRPTFSVSDAIRSVYDYEISQIQLHA